MLDTPAEAWHQRSHMSHHQRAAVLVLEDGRHFRGTGIGSEGPALGELVFNTSMTGYQEIFSDPSYAGQIVTLCFPQVGNYGACPDDEQSTKPALSGVVIRELSPYTSGHRCRGGLEEWLHRHAICGISEIDTRAVTRHIRSRGAMRAGIFSGQWRPEMPELVRSHPALVGRDLTAGVTTTRPFLFPAEGVRQRRVALLDFGVKQDILKQLASRGLEVMVLPASTPAEKILAEKPAGVVLSNGPGDPEAVGAGIETARALLSRLPLLGICLGHQLLSLALGARTYKLPFGHHGGNHPVKELAGGRVMITAQNHGFAVDEKSLPENCRPTHTSLYDGTLEGFSAPALQLLAVQFHPESAPGPSDAREIFEDFMKLLDVN